MKKFLIPVDFSDASARALRFVFAINKHFFAKLQVIHLFDVPFAIGDETGQSWANYETYRKTYEQELWDFINSNKGDYHFDIDVQVTSGGHYQGIMGFAKQSNTDLIIIGNKGSGQLKRWRFGSVAKYLLTHPTIPVLSIPENLEKDSIRKILFTTDLTTPLTETHFQFLKNFAANFEAEIHILHAREKNEQEIAIESVVAESIKKYLGKNPEILTKKDGQTIRDAIHEYTEANKIDLLITIPHFHTWLDRLLIGSETAELISKEQIPILSLPEKML